MKIRWAPAAANDLEQIGLFLEEAYPYLREITLRTIYSSVLSLKAFPRRGRKGKADGTRELILPRLPYVIVYRVTDLAVEIVRIWHGAQDRYRTP